ncbi:hypothetical protein PGT21_007124 [Puccinia graminis f. sp. tritici]|uniref:Uncharacterized protein n=1 Tax=Puccinia graminis f. sp. tritici TaxID=56615 RepID=A0A5B0PQX7_PUCGR|nr:hypothetical protein PGT21_007124 [Puccinia graminis f. sp. tritici]
MDTRPYLTSWARSRSPTLSSGPGEPYPSPCWQRLHTSSASDWDQVARPPPYTSRTDDAAAVYPNASVHLTAISLLAWPALPTLRPSQTGDMPPSCLDSETLCIGPNQLTCFPSCSLNSKVDKQLAIMPLAFLCLLRVKGLTFLLLSLAASANLNSKANKQLAAPPLPASAPSQTTHCPVRLSSSAATANLLSDSLATLSRLQVSY